MNPRRLQALFRAYFRTDQQRQRQKNVGHDEAAEQQSLLSYLMGGG